MSREGLPDLSTVVCRHLSGSSCVLKSVSIDPDLCPPKPSVPAPVGTTISSENMVDGTCDPKSPLMRATEVEGFLKHQPRQDTIKISILSLNIHYQESTFPH